MLLNCLNNYIGHSSWLLEYQKFLIFILTVLYNYFNNLTKLFSDSYPTKFFYIATNYFVIAPRVTCVEIMRSLYCFTQSMFYSMQIVALRVKWIGDVHRMHCGLFSFQLHFVITLVRNPCDVSTSSTSKYTGCKWKLHVRQNKFRDDETKLHPQ